MKIAINAGHCPDLDPGACGVYSTEAEVVRDIAEYAIDSLEKMGHDVIFIQEDELADICAIANDAECDLFISIHCNAANNMAHGTETFYYQMGDQSFYLSVSVQRKIVNCLDTLDRGVKDGSWLYVIRNTDMPAILTEVGFIDNEEEEKLINLNIEEIGKAIADGIQEYADSL